MKRAIIVLMGLLVFHVMLASTANGYDVNYSRISSEEMKLDFTTDFTISVVEKDGVKYSMINGAGSTVTNLEGYAEIPFHSTTVQLKDDKNVTMKYSSVDYEDIVLDHPLLPSRGTIFRNQDPSTIPYEIASESIKDEWYPGKVSEITDPFILRDVRGTNVLVYPYQYNAKTNTLRVHKTQGTYIYRHSPSNRSRSAVVPTIPWKSRVSSHWALQVHENSRIVESWLM